MKVAPVSEIPGYLPANVPQIYISKDVSASITFERSPSTVGHLANLGVPPLTLAGQPQNVKLAGCAQLLAAPSSANLSGGTLITRGIGSGGDHEQTEC